ncbi:T9SS type A sorting domain-containing protein [Dysgonomonas sp. GY75]|uniref:T9SS type A sorting domain-containing protein n=1 Tax=Dysgonomonas sp. GY75 TaxID=2780419 RepID=UPI001883A7DE|nr:T9SS type A sorting domain-containing protein [Dysgonomonas sp. GY75]MBF0649229.1 T9SS type A sorting domain-containing protein [Dysgonomonas sp. GY75]
MKRQFIIKLTCLLFLCIITIPAIPIKAQAVQSAWHGKISIGDIPVLMHGDLALQSDGELFTNNGRMELEGSYYGEPGSRAYRYIKGTAIDADIDASFFLDASIATGSTEIIPELDEGWDGSPVELVKAGLGITAIGTGTSTGSSVFYIEPKIPDCGDLYVQLLHKGNGNNSVWSLTGTITLPLIKQLRNHTLLINNNPDTNDGHNFSYYKWYKDGQQLKEGSHKEHGGSYYTGGANLDENAVYMVEVTDADGKRYFSCPYSYVPIALPASVKVYPNPVSRDNSRVYVQVETTDEKLLEQAEVEVYSYTGSYYGKVQAKGQHTIPVDLPKASGIYILKFKSKEMETGLKAVVQ